ncbi:MAG TPA: ABC transporter substrate-binding protein [Stellaceae bacterium]|jgi:putative ABC transport system substrate-binding protein|nr:ABC transporter substrate-binding protein [Stellaceae bacterium]
MQIRWPAVVIALAAALPSARAVADPVKIGVMTPGPTSAVTAMGNGIAAALTARGLVRDRDFAIDIRAAEGKEERLPALARELVADHVAVIVVGSYPATRAAKDASTTTPVVSLNAGEPDETGIAASLAHPGGNVTGLSDLSSELSAKRLDLLRLAVPGMKKVAMLWNADDLGMTGRYNAASAAAKAMGIMVEALGVREPDDFGASFRTMDKDKPDGILMVTDILTILNRKRVIDYAAANKIPAIYEFDNFARDGGLMSYGPDGKELLSRVADLVVRILKGAKPADLPFEQPTLFQFVINQKTADAIGLKLPPALLARADEVID